ncbi:hypothetical protein MKX01_011959 [Papaver californicum]|nr:hypothetical protein MKX01_011959 [Papaver californicum]
MLSMTPCRNHLQSPFTFNPMFQKLQSHTQSFQSHQKQATKDVVRGRRKLVMVVRGSQSEEEVVNKKNQERQSFLSLEEAGLVEMSGLSTHERFLCRLTISSLNLLRVVSEQEGVPIEELNAGKLCDWFMKDKLKREQNLGSAVLQWDDSNLPF